MHFSIFWNVFFKGPLVAKWRVSHSMLRVREEEAYRSGSCIRAV